jgi:hypothetical protein
LILVIIPTLSLPLQAQLKPYEKPVSATKITEEEYRQFAEAIKNSIVESNNTAYFNLFDCAAHPMVE